MSFHDPIRRSRGRGVAAGQARGSRTRRRKRSAVRAAELRLVVLLGLLLGVGYGGMEAPSGWGDIASDKASQDRPAPVAASFSLCHRGGGWNCVVDGDTFYTEGAKVRVADIDTPETHPPRCAAEARLGEAATLRLQALLNAGPFTLASIDRDEDQYGRKLRVVVRDGESLGDTLVAEGLARTYAGGRRPWC